MKKISFTINGRRFEVELDNDFALYVLDRLSQSKIVDNRDNDVPKLLNAYLKALKENYDNQKQIEELLVDIST
jgi:predicted DNA-binding transcriptional regulator YafY